ncbi:MAG: hypothetical protein AAB865_03125 [Patescibacteria group bacterium]
MDKRSLGPVVVLFVLAVLLGIWAEHRTPTPERDGVSDTVNYANSTLPNSANSSTKTNTTSKPETSTNSVTSTATDEDEPAFYITINYTQGAAFNPETYEVPQGKHVVMRVTSSKSDTLELQGHTQNLALKAGVQGTYEFDADTLGAYEISLYDQGQTLGYINVVAVK